MVGGLLSWKFEILGNSSGYYFRGWSAALSNTNPRLPRTPALECTMAKMLSGWPHRQVREERGNHERRRRRTGRVEEEEGRPATQRADSKGDNLGHDGRGDEMFCKRQRIARREKERKYVELSESVEFINCLVAAKEAPMVLRGSVSEGWRCRTRVGRSAHGVSGLSGVRGGLCEVFQ